MSTDVASEESVDASVALYVALSVASGWSNPRDYHTARHPHRERHTDAKLTIRPFRHARHCARRAVPRLSGRHARTRTTFRLGVPAVLAMSETRLVRGTEVQVTFVDVPENSLCPPKVQCAWAGQVVVRK